MILMTQNFEGARTLTEIAEAGLKLQLTSHKSEIRQIRSTGDKQATF
jgi:hypothetical protein